MTNIFQTPILSNSTHVYTSSDHSPRCSPIRNHFKAGKKVFHRSNKAFKLCSHDVIENTLQLFIQVLTRSYLSVKQVFSRRETPLEIYTYTHTTYIYCIHTAMPQRTFSRLQRANMADACKVFIAVDGSKCSNNAVKCK